jgi:transposase InsO family protein
MYTKAKGESIDTLCGLFGKRRQSYYKKKKYVTTEAFQGELMLQMIAHERNLMPRLGGRKLYFKIRPRLPSDFQMGRDKFFVFLKHNDLLVRKKRYRAITTMSSHWLRKYPNLIRDFVPTGSHQLWVSDITYVETKEGFVYLFLITDAYSRKVVGWCVSMTLEAKNAVKALHMALGQLPAGVKNLIHHSDRGVQYCSSKYVDILNKHEINISMTEKGDPLENAVAERINGILKTEWINEMKLESLKDAIFQIRNIISIYNRERPHSSIEMLTPEQAHLGSGPLKRLWKNYYKRKEEICQA